MDDTSHTYMYNGKMWKQNSTVSDKDSFFHAAFGNKISEATAYLDKQAKVRRMRWATFLTYFQAEPMPPSLTDQMTKCFLSNEKYENASVQDELQLENYVSDIITAPQHVTVEEIQILATLENIRVVVLTKDSVWVAEPNAELLGNYLNVQKPKEGVVLCLEGNIFSRLDVVEENSTPAAESNSSDENVNETYRIWTKYDKGGSAGSKGVEYQVGILTLFLLNSVRRLKDWRLSTENKAAGKFDDAVLEWQDGAVLLQAKHKESKTKKITLEDLMSTNSKNDDFSLIKYFLSYLEIKEIFNLTDIIICTNQGVDGKTSKIVKGRSINSDSMLYYGEADCLFYTFSEDILPGLKEGVTSYYNTNRKNKSVDDTMITDENLKGFLKHLRLFCNYPRSNDMGKAVEGLLSLMKRSTPICGLISSPEINAKIMDWFQQKNGVYLNDIYAKGLFYEIERDRRWHVLEEYRVHFQRDDFNFPDSKRILHINVGSGYLLQEIKICSALRSHKAKILRLVVDDSLQTYSQVIESFSLPPYTFLIILSPKSTEESILLEIGGKLKGILDKYQYKKVVLVSEGDALLQYIKSDTNVHLVIKEPIRFEDVSRDTQERLLKKEKLIFQGDRVSLDKILVEQHYNKVLTQNALEKLIINEDIFVGARLVDLDEDVSRFYIDRKFETTKEERRETLSEEAIFDVDDKVILISDHAGMGKTTVIAKLAVAIKMKYRPFWVIRIELNDYTKILRDTLDKNCSVIDIIQLLKSKHTTELRTETEREIFLSNGKVVLMLDGIDEISPDFTELVVNMMVECQKAQNFAKIFVTTRPHMTTTLEALLEVKSFTLHPFTKPDQIDFLTRYWMHNLRETKKDKCKAYAEALLIKTSGWIKSDGGIENHFAAIPLQIRMLAEIFQERHTSSWDGCKEFLGGEKVEPNLPESLDIVKLYDMFVEKKRQVFVKKGNPSGNTAANRALNDQFEECLLYHRSLALEVILGKPKCELCSDHRPNDEDLEINVLKMGIVQKLEGEFHFVHRTFAEYFVAQSLLKDLKHQNSSTDFQMFFVDEVLLGSGYHITRAFLEHFISKVVDVLPATTFERYQSVTEGTASSLLEKIGIIHHLAKEGCAAILELLFKCVDCTVARDQQMRYQNLWNMCLKNVHVHGNALSLLKYILEQTGVNIKDDIGKTPLDYAVDDNHLKTVKFLVDQGANVNQQYWQPLHTAVKMRYAEMAKFLIERGADMKAKDSDGHSVFYNAILLDLQDIAAYIYDKIVASEVVHKENHLIPYAAAYLGLLDVLKDLIEDGLDVDAAVEDERTLVFGAVRGNQLETIEYLVLCEADVNKKDHHDDTPLHTASANPSQLSTALLLVKLGADVDTMNSGGMTALHIAAFEGNFDLVQAFLEIFTKEDKAEARLNSTSEMGSTPLYLAASSGHLDIVKFLVESGANIYYRNKDGRTAIDAATFSHRLDIVKYFIQLGMDINATDNYKRNCLHSAALMGQLDTVKFALKLGVDVNGRDHEDCTPLYLAAMWRHLDVVNFLVEHGAYVNLGNIKGFKPLQMLAGTGQVRVVENLLKHGAEVNSSDSRGYTALHEAVSRGHFATANVLLRNGADVNITDGEGRTPLHLVPREKPKLALLLLQYGADSNARDNEGRVAIDADFSSVLADEKT